MFKVIISFKIITALTIFCYLFADLLSRLLVFYKFLWKINGNYLSFACLSNKISFLSYSIFNLLLPELQSGSATLGDSLYIIPHRFLLCQAFFHLFFIFFAKILKSFLFFAFAVSFSYSPQGQLDYLTTLFLLCQLFFYTFFKKFTKIYKNFNFSCF